MLVLYPLSLWFRLPSALLDAFLSFPAGGADLRVAFALGFPACVRVCLESTKGAAKRGIGGSGSSALCVFPPVTQLCAVYAQLGPSYLELSATPAMLDVHLSFPACGLALQIAIPSGVWWPEGFAVRLCSRQVWQVTQDYYRMRGATTAGAPNSRNDGSGSFAPGVLQRFAEPSADPDFPVNLPLVLLCHAAWLVVPFGRSLLFCCTLTVWALFSSGSTRAIIPARSPTCASCQRRPGFCSRAARFPRKTRLYLFILGTLA